MKVYLIRHAQSQNNALMEKSVELYEAERVADPKISDLGIKEARCTGKRHASLSMLPVGWQTINRSSKSHQHHHRFGILVLIFISMRPLSLLYILIPPLS